MAMPRSRVFKDDDGYWTSLVFYADKWAGVASCIFKSRIFDRALEHAIRNS